MVPRSGSRLGLHEMALFWAQAVAGSAAPVRGAISRMRFLINAHADSIGIQIVRMRRQKREGAPRCSSSWRTRACLCAPWLSMITMSPACFFGAKRPATQPTNRSALCPTTRSTVRAEIDPRSVVDPANLSDDCRFDSVAAGISPSVPLVSRPLLETRSADYAWCMGGLSAKACRLASG